MKILLQLIQRTIFLALICSTICIAQQIPDGPYFGQQTPGLVPEIFAPGIICLENRFEQNAAFSPDGKEFFFSLTNSSWGWFTIMYTKQENGHWTTPVTASFLGDFYNCEPCFSHDGQKLFFTSPRPSAPPWNTDIWMTERTETGWKEPVNLGPQVNSNTFEWHVSVTTDGTLYFLSRRAGGEGLGDLYCSRLTGNGYSRAENLGYPINTNSQEGDPFIAPDESYLIFTSHRSGGYGKGDLYISFRKNDGSWGTPINFGPHFNTAAYENGSTVSPDGKFLFFTRRQDWNTNIDSDIYWVSVKAILPDPNGPVLNLTTGQRFASLQTAINYAQSGQSILLSPGRYEENIILPPKELTIRSANAQDSAIVSLTTISGDSEFPVLNLLPGSTIKLLGLTICDGAMGISCSEAQLQMNHCVVTGNQGCGVEVSDESHLEMSHCIVAGNTETGLHSLAKTVGRGESLYSHVDITNCTIVQNQQYAIDGNEIAVVNSILYFNGESVDGAQINGNNLNVIFSDVQGGFVGQGNIDANPEFVELGTWADPNNHLLGDYHLKSTDGHWDPMASTWVLDETSSPCIDAGKQNEPIGSEPLENGGIINMGAYGGTPEASRTRVPEQTDNQ